MSLSRVRRSQDVWIFRKFPRHVFCGGGQVGPELLLKRLRGEAIAWEQVAEKLRGRPQRCEKDSPQVVCATCGLCPATEFTIRELLKGPQRQCTACSNCRRCPTCTVAIPPGTSRCLWCAGYSICRSCGQEFLSPGNSQHAWCAACQKKHGTLWVCGRCTLAKPLRHFSQQRDWYAPTTLQQKRRRRCDACVQEERRRDHASHTVPTQESTPVQPAAHTTQPPGDAALRCCGCGPRTASDFFASWGGAAVRAVSASATVFGLREVLRQQAAQMPTTRRPAYVPSLRQVVPSDEELSCRGPHARLLPELCFARFPLQVRALLSAETAGGLPTHPQSAATHTAKEVRCLSR